MVIQQISIENFRMFEKQEIDFHHKLTVLIGINGSGKTSLLDAVAAALGGYLSGIDGIPARDLFKDEVRIMGISEGSAVNFYPQFPLVVFCKAVIEKEEYKWTRALNSEEGKTTRIDAKKIRGFANKMQKNIRESGEPVVLPMIAYYGAGRLFLSKKQKTEKTMKRISSRFVGYVDCLTPAINEKLTQNWIEKMTLIKLQAGKEPEELIAVRRALCKCLDIMADNYPKGNVSDVYFDVAVGETIVTFSTAKGDTHKLPLAMLSDGYRITLGMIKDIASRMAVLNPNMGENVIEETPGIVLIDEVDLHLHPKWQRRILRMLMEVFPRVQFIVTTHSPNVLTEVSHEHIRLLNEKGVSPLSVYTRGRDVNSILFDAMGVEERPEDVSAQIHAIYRDIESEAFEDAEMKINQLEVILGSNDAEITRAKAFLELER